MEDKVTQGWNRTRRQPTPQEEARLAANLGRVPLQVTTLLETHMPARELLALRPGDVIALGHSAQAPVEIQVAGIRRFAGRLTAEFGGVGVTVEGAPPAVAETALALVGVAE
jgi:flagellar motor switch protein FliM